MKKRLFLALTVCILTLLCFVPFSAQATSWLTKIGGTIFKAVMSLLGFDSGLNNWCWFCPIIRTLLESANRIASAVYDKTEGVLLLMLGVGTLFFIAFKVGAMVVKLQEVDLMQFMGEMFKVLGRVIIAAVILTSAPFIVDTIITPFVAYSAEFALNVLDNVHVDNKIYRQVDKMLDYTNDAAGARAQAENAITAWATTNPGDNSSGAFINSALVDSLIAIVAKISANLVVGLAVGLVLIVLSGLSSVVFYDVSSFLSGGVVFLSFATLLITVPFQVINMAIQLTFVLALLPFWVVLWVFPVTAQYTKKAWDMFIHSCLSIMIFGILAALVLQLLGYMLPNADDILTSMIPGYDLIAGKKASAFSSNTLLTLALGFLCRELLKSAPELATRITSVYGMQSADNMVAAVSAAIASGAAAGGTMLGLSKAFAGAGYETAQSVGKTGSDMVRGVFGLKEKESIMDVFTGSGSDNTSTSKAAPKNTYTPQSTSGQTTNTQTTNTGQTTNGQ